MDQVEQYELPPNPAKVTDSRYEKYAEEHGEESWELDALRSQVIIDLVRATVLDMRDEDAYNARVELEDEHRGRLEDMVERERKRDAGEVDEDDQE